MTTAQTIFVIALSVAAIIIIGFACFVFSSTLWSGRWYPKQVRKTGKDQS